MRRGKARLFVVLVAVAVLVPVGLLAKSRFYPAQAPQASSQDRDVLREGLQPAPKSETIVTEVQPRPAPTPPPPAPNFTPTPPPLDRPAQLTSTSSPASGPTSAAASRPATVASTEPTSASAPAVSTAPAGSLDEARRFLAEGKLLEARNILADQLNSGKLGNADVILARQKLLELGEKMIFSHDVYPGDPCTYLYQVRPGDMLVRLERDQKLHVPPQSITKVNGIRPDKLQIGQSLKLIRGPFHAVVYKSRFIMDVYLSEPQTGRMILVKTFRVGLGREDCTPLGKWRLALGGKILRAPWAPPPSAGLAAKTIRWGEPDYPLGKEGYWISLEGTDGNALTSADGYGIHGTNEPGSIGKAGSHGCIRLSDEDIDQVFSLLYEQWSTVNILP